MARIRTIKPEFWTDSKTGTLSAMAKVLFLGMLNHCDDYGFIRYDLMEFKARIMPYEQGSAHDVVGSLLVNEIFSRNLASVLSIDSVMYLHITNFEKHQKVDKPGKPIIEQWKSGMSLEEFGKIAESFHEFSLEPKQLEIIDSESIRENSRVLAPERKGKERNKIYCAFDNARHADFEKFWDAFAYKRGRGSAEKSWMQIKGYNSELVERIIDSATKEAAQRPQLIARGSTPKMAQGWLTERRWEDEYPEVQEKWKINLV